LSLSAIKALCPYSRPARDFDAPLLRKTLCFIEGCQLAKFLLLHGPVGFLEQLGPLRRDEGVLQETLQLVQLSVDLGASTLQKNGRYKK
jgi:hypothetical protein